MKKKLFVLIALALVASVATSAYSPAAKKTGCPPNGSYIYAYSAEKARVYWFKMSSGLMTNKGFFDLGFGPGYSADGKFDINRCAIVTSWVTPAGHSNIYKVSATGRWLKNLTDTKNLDGIIPWFTPNGQNILFTVYDGNNVPSVMSMDRNGYGYSVLFPNTSAGPTFSWWVSMWTQYNVGFATSLRAVSMRPEGNLVAFITDDGTLDIVIIDPVTYMPQGKPTHLLVGANLTDVKWVNIPYQMLGSKP